MRRGDAPVSSMEARFLSPARQPRVLGVCHKELCIVAIQDEIPKVPAYAHVSDDHQWSDADISLPFRILVLADFFSRHIHRSKLDLADRKLRPCGSQP